MDTKYFQSIFKNVNKFVSTLIFRYIITHVMHNYIWNMYTHTCVCMYCTAYILNCTLMNTKARFIFIFVIILSCYQKHVLSMEKQKRELIQ